MIDNKQQKKIIPRHVGIVLGGDQQWAAERNLSFLDGYARSVEKIKQAPSWFFPRGIKILSVFAFPQKYWGLPKERVNYLMKLFREFIDEEIKNAAKNEYKILISGRINELPGDLPEACLELMDKTKDKTEGALNICLNYDGKTEMVDAVRKIIKAKVEQEQAHEGLIKKYLYNGSLGDVDIMVITSGKQKLSSFLTWQTANSELLFFQKYWPEFEERDVNSIIEEYSKRKTD